MCLILLILLDLITLLIFSEVYKPFLNNMLKATRLVTVMSIVFWDVMPLILVARYQRFRWIFSSVYTAP